MSIQISIASTSGSPTDGLLDIRDVVPRGEADNQLFVELYEVLKKHNALKRFGITLLHKHFDVSCDEMLVELTDRDSRTHTIQPAKKSDYSGQPIIETSWRLDNNYIQMGCSCIKNGSDHSHQHRYSDARLKDNVVPIQGALAKVMNLKPKSYFYKPESVTGIVLPVEAQVGLLAQDLEAVVPEAVHCVRPTAESGADYKKVDYVSLIPILVGAIQEQQKIIERLQAVLNGQEVLAA